ncbi:hypothetical protein IEQ34_000384 [Dendrobium chrysotoxum]|uniref:Uncharacterized protein n=1 Tax=Dendrobium chrysotoxum TaxID=161865 RepID=A0AAV7HPQ5_DENCH|nr:hypothetical protein IEQ34_000384 [Dendrobium chrysotoxum]
MSGDHLPSRDPAIRGDLIAPYDCEWVPNKEARVNETASTVTSDFLILFCKNFHFPNDVVTIVPKRSDRASLPPSGYLTISETNLRAGLRFPPPAELIKILRRCGVNLSQFSFRAMSVTVGLIALFRNRGATLTPEHLSRMGRFTSDTHGRVTFRSKWLDLRTLGEDEGSASPSACLGRRHNKDPQSSDIEHLLFEVRHMSRYIEEEFLFKVGLSFHAGRSDAKMLKPTSKAPEPPAPTSKVASKRSARGEDPQVLKKKRLEGTATNTDKALPDSSPAKFHIPEEVSNHQYIGRHKAGDLWSRLGIELTDILDEWNSEFVKIKYLQGEFKRKYDHKTKEAKVLEEELNECRTELANTMQSISLQNRQADQHQIDLAEARATITQLLKDQKASKEKIVSLEAKDKRSRTLIAEKEAALSGSELSKVIEDFKKSIAFKTIIQDHVQEARDHIYDIEVKALEQQCIEDGFIRGFLKGVHLMQRKTGVQVEGVTPSQALDDFPSGSDGDEIEIELHKATDLDVDDETANI